MRYCTKTHSLVVELALRSLRYSFLGNQRHSEYIFFKIRQDVVSAVLIPLVSSSKLFAPHQMSSS